jgi:hypothetical protein
MEKHQAATKIQTTWRGVLAAAKVLAVWMRMKNQEEIRAVIQIQSAARASMAQKNAKVRRELAQDLGWTRLPESDNPALEYSPDKKLYLKLSSSDVDDLFVSLDKHQSAGNEKGGTEQYANRPQHNSLEKLNAEMMRTGFTSEHLDLGLAHFAPPELDPEVLEKITFNKHLVEDEDYYHSDGSDEQDGGRNTHKKGFLETATIGKAEENEDGAHVSSSDSDSDSDSDNGKGLASSSRFQSFKTGKLGIRTMAPPKPPPPSTNEQWHFQNTSDRTSQVPTMDIDYIPNFLNTKASVLRGNSGGNEEKKTEDVHPQKKKNNVTFHESPNAPKGTFQVDAASKGSEEKTETVDDHPISLFRQNIIPPTSPSPRSPDVSQVPRRNRRNPSLSVHVVGDAATHDMGHITSLSEETPRSIANAYGMKMSTLLELNEVTLPKGINVDEPLWLGTPIMLPVDAVQTQDPSVNASTSFLGSRGTSRSHRQNATGIAAQTSLLKEASKLSTKHLLRMNGQPNDILSSYADAPILSPEHKNYALDIYDAGQDEHGAQYRHSSDPFSHVEGKSTIPVPKRKWFLPYDAKVDLDTVGRIQSLRSGRMSKGICEDGRRDRRAAEHLARKHDQEIAEMLQLKQASQKISRDLKKQYNTGPSHNIIRQKGLNGRILRQQVSEGNMTQFERLSKFAPLAVGTDRIVENVKFIGRLLMVNPSTGSPSKRDLNRTPAVQPGSRLTLRIDATSIGFADEKHPIQQRSNDVGCVLAVQRGTLINFEVRTGKKSGLRVVIPSSHVSRGPRGSRNSGNSGTGRYNRYPHGVGGSHTRGNASPTSKNKSSKAEPCRMLWKGNRCVVDIPMFCGKGAVSGMSSVKLNLLVGQHIGILKFNIDVMSSYVSTGGGQRQKKRNAVSKEKKGKESDIEWVPVVL